MRQAEVARDSLKVIMESIGLQMISTDFQDRVLSEIFLEFMGKRTDDDFDFDCD